MGHKKPYMEQKPWGSFTQFTYGAGELVTVKTILVKRGEGLSLQRHKFREEEWYVLKGEPTVTIGSKILSARPGDTFCIPQGTVHRIEAPMNEALILEIARGEFREDDIERLEDRYGRV